MQTRAELQQQLTTVLGELFEVPPEKVKPDARLYEDLDLDSIDAVDLIVRLQTMTGRRIKPEEFKAVRTVNDILDCLQKLLSPDAPT
jgi:acyl carrier protein